MLGGFYTFRTGGSVVIEGFWNASTNNPTLVSGVGVAGTTYIVSVAGTTNIDGITDWQVGDIIYFDGTQWRKEDHTCQWDKDTQGIKTDVDSIGIGSASAGNRAISSIVSGATGIHIETELGEQYTKLLGTTASKLEIASEGTTSIEMIGSGSEHSVVSINNIGTGNSFLKVGTGGGGGSSYIEIEDDPAPLDTTNRLYNISGLLTWNGKKVRTSNKYSFTLPGSLVAAAGQLSFASPISGTIGRINAKVGTAPTGDDIDIDINKNGSSILTGNLTIAATETTGYVDPTTTEVAEGDIFIIDIDTVGSTIPGGSDLWIWFEIV